MAFAARGNMKGIFLAVAAFSLFSAGDAAYKHLSPHYSSFTLLFYASFFSLPLYLAVSPWLGGVGRTFRSRNLRLHLVRGFMLFFQTLLFVLGLGAMDMAKAYALVFAAPFIAPALSAVFLKEHASRQQWLVIAAGFCGVLVILRPGIIPVDFSSLSLIASAFLFSLSNVLARYMGREKDETMLAWGFLPEFSTCLCAAIAVIPVFVVPAPAHIALLFFIAAVGVAGMTCISLAFAKSPSAVVAPFHYIQMVWGTGFGYLLFGDVPDGWTAAGAAIIIASGLWLIRHDGKQAPPPLTVT